MRVPVVPFLIPPDGAVTHHGWSLATGDTEDELPAEMDHWDYQMVLPLHGTVSLDRQRIDDSCHLGPQSAMALMVTTQSSHTRIEQLVHRTDLQHDAGTDIRLAFRLPGHLLGGQLTIQTTLVVTAPDPTDQLGASRAGSILWQHSQKTRLEGVGAQFPTDSADFTLTNLAAPDAGWDLRIDLSDPDAPFMAAVRLTLNSAHPAIARMMAGERSDATDQLLKTLNWDVTRQLVMRALDSDEVAALAPDTEAIHVGAVLRNLLATIWPHESVDTLLRWREDEPARIETRLQSHCRLLIP